MTAVTTRHSCHHLSSVLHDLSSRGMWETVGTHGKGKLLRSEKNWS